MAGLRERSATRLRRANPAVISRLCEGLSSLKDKDKATYPADAGLRERSATRLRRANPAVVSRLY